MIGRERELPTDSGNRVMPLNHRGPFIESESNLTAAIRRLYRRVGERKAKDNVTDEGPPCTFSFDEPTDKDWENKR